MPHVESEFLPWVENYVTVMTENAVAWSVTPAETSKLAELLGKFKEKYAIAKTPATQTQAARQAKNDAKTALESYVRKIYRKRLLHNDDVTNEERDLLQVPIHDKTNTPSALPQSSPVAFIDTSVHLQHKIKVTDSITATKRGGLPHNVRGFELWRKIDGPQPSTESEFSYLARPTSSLYVESYTLENAGKQIWYRARWVNSRNQPGPWSGIFGAIVP